MIILIGSLPLSMIPAFAMYFWLKTKGGAADPVGYKILCKEALKNGLLSTLAALPISAILAFILKRFAHVGSVFVKHRFEYQVD